MLLDKLLFRRRISILIIICLLSLYVMYESTVIYLGSIKQSRQYLQHTTNELDNLYIQRAILIFYSSSQESHFSPEIRWLYRSWIEMMQYESKRWRTDLIVYTEKYSSLLRQLGCILNYVRVNKTEPPRCRVFLYLRLSYRRINPSTQQQNIFIDNTPQDFYHIDIQRSMSIYKLIKSYEYIDSVNIIAEAYPTYKYYDFILKTDIDVFLTKPFAKHIPISNRTLLAGRGGYSTAFNTRRLRRVANDLNWLYANMTNIGSTWYGAPCVAQRVASLTLDAMLYLSENEFTRPERERKLGVMLWPDWHYGVLSMYGTHLSVNHLVIAEGFDIKKADQLLDQLTTDSDQNDIEKNNRLHLHCWHTDQQFSKFRFKAGKYKQIHPRTLIHDHSARGYALRMALESALMSPDELGQRLNDIKEKKSI